MTATATRTFNFKKIFGKDVTPFLGRGVRTCPQCSGVGIEDGVKIASCRKCSGAGLVKVAQADDESLANLPSETPPSTSDEFRVDYEAAPDDAVKPSVPELPPDQMRKAIAAMLSGSFKRTIAAVFTHVATMDKMPAQQQAEHDPDTMLDYLYSRLDKMNIDELKSTFDALRKNE